MPRATFHGRSRSVAPVRSASGGAGRGEESRKIEDRDDYQGERQWSAKVTKRSNALDLQPYVFEQDDPKQIPDSLKRSAEHSRRRKASPLQSAMSMLTFYINPPAGTSPHRASVCWRKPRANS